MNRPLADSELLQLQRWNTPTIYDGWEQITKHDSATSRFQLKLALTTPTKSKTTLMP